MSSLTANKNAGVGPSFHCRPVIYPVMCPTNLILGEGVRQIFAEREACRTTGMFYGVIALGLFADDRIACLGGMAGEW